MDQDHLPAQAPSTASRFWAAILASSAILLLPFAARAQSYGPNVFPPGAFNDVKSTYVPWAGVDGQGNLHGIEGKQIAVDDNGRIETDNYGHGTATFAPGFAVADLNGDGKPDLIMADSFGFFWFYPNSGTAAKPVFTQGEIMPIWLGEDRTDRDVEGYDNVVPRIQLADVSGTGKFDIIAGTYEGKLFVIPNLGNSKSPVFKPTENLDPMLVNTHRHGVLWCNYLSPFLTTAFSGTNRLDLLMGEGTYSANSIYLLHNQGANGTFAFDEDHLEKLIPGMGSEQLTPCIVDWNNDGKPDVICGDRTGFLDLFLNTSIDRDHPTFAPPVHVKIAGQEKIGNSITVAVCDLSENKLPNLLIGKDDGTINYAVNTGKLGAPVFLVPPTPLKGVLPANDHYMAFNDWEKRQAYGVPYELLSAVNPKLEPGFTFPDGETTQYAMKFSVWPVKSAYFPDRYYIKTEDEWRQHVVAAPAKFNLLLNKRYRIHFWAKADRNVDIVYRLRAQYGNAEEKYWPPAITDKTASLTSAWTECTANVEFDNTIDPKITNWDFFFEFRFTSQPTFYIDDLQIQQAL